MPATALTVQKITLGLSGGTYSGVTPTYATPDATNGNEFVNKAGRTLLHVKNTNAATRTVTVVSQQKCDQGHAHNVAVVIPATTGDKMLGPFTPSEFNDSNDKVQITWDASAGVSVAAFELVEDGR